MKINIYYGGRGLIDDPTLYVISKMQEVFDELNVRTQRYNLFEQKNNIATLPQTFKDADGIILATTVEADAGTYSPYSVAMLQILLKSSGEVFPLVNVRI